MALRLGALACAAMLLSATAASCALAGYDFDKGAPGAGAKAAGGHGGEGGAGAGPGGAGGGPTCKIPADCPGMDDECGHRECQVGACVVVFTAADTVITSQTPQDCSVLVCDGKGEIVTKEDPSDPFDDANDCTDNLCADGKPSNPNSQVDTACGKDGALKCDGRGHCDCMTNDQCGVDDSCVHWVCAAGVCESMNLNEGADCGVCLTCQGAVCAPAPDGVSDTDCPTNACHTGTCNGNGGCKSLPVGTQCGTGGCTGDTLIPPATCDAGGICAAGSPVDCAPYTCVGNGMACTSACTDIAQCADSYDCEPSSQTCVDCTTCYEWFAMPGPSTFCPGSQQLKDDLVDCVCMLNCKSDCGGNLCMQMSPSNACVMCMNSMCTQEKGYCQADLGLH